MTSIPYYIHLVAAVLSVCRVVQIVTQDSLFARVRAIPGRTGKFFSCARCISVWAGAGGTLAFMFLPWLNWPFALSWLYFLSVEFIRLLTTLQWSPSKSDHPIVMDVDPSGQWHVRSLLGRQQTRDAIQAMLQTIDADTRGT